MQAAVIIERDGSVHEQPNHGRLEAMYPLEGKVFSCDHHSGKTIISVYQTIPNLFRFSNLNHNRAFLMIPEFWNFLEERSEWNDLIPRGSVLRDLKQQRYQHPDIADNAWAVYRYARLAGIFAGDEVRQINGGIFTKIEQLHRLMRRVQYGNRLKLHFLTLSTSEGRSYVLDELIHEGPMTLEHAAFAAYAILDLTAHLVNQVLQIGVSELNTSFTAVLGKDSSNELDANLRNLFPTLPLTAFWQAEQNEWIANLRDLRHEFAHRGAASPAYGPNEKLLAFNFNVPAGEVSPFYDVEEIVSDWFIRAERFFIESLRLLADYSLQAVVPYELAPVKPPIAAPKPNSDIEATQREVLRLLFASNSEEPKREEFLYSRLSREWRKEWPFDKFRAFLSAIDSIAMDPKYGVGYSSGGDSASATVKVVLSMQDKALGWLIRLEKPRRQRAYLVKTPMTLPLNMEPQTSVADFLAKQSGRETGHRCAEFHFTVTNSGHETLTNVSAVIAHGDLEVASAHIGELRANESARVFAITTPELGTMLPPGGPYFFVTLISEPVMVRVTYDQQTLLGDCWADEHRCENPRIRP